jgi:hypothetical protein
MSSLNPSRINGYVVNGKHKTSEILARTTTSYPEEFIGREAVK